MFFKYFFTILSHREELNSNLIKVLVVNVRDIHLQIISYTRSWIIHRRIFDQIYDNAECINQLKKKNQKKCNFETVVTTIW